MGKMAKSVSQLNQLECVQEKIQHQASGASWNLTEWKLATQSVLSVAMRLLDD